MTNPITEQSIQQRVQAHPEVGGIPPGASDGNILMFLSGEVAWGDSGDLALTANKITDGELSETALEVSSVSPELLGTISGVQSFKIRRYLGNDGYNVTSLDVLGGDVLNLTSSQDVRVNGNSLLSAITKLSTIEQNAQVNYTEVSVNSEATPVDSTGNVNVLTTAGVNSLSEALSNTSTFPNLKSNLRSYSPREVVQIFSNFSPPKFDFARDTVTTPNAVRSFSTNDVLTAIQHLAIDTKASSISFYNLAEADSGKLLRFPGTGNITFTIPASAANFRVGFYVIVEQSSSTRKLTFAATTPCTVSNVYGATKTYGVGALVLLVHMGNGVWNLSGAVGL